MLCSRHRQYRRFQGRSLCQLRSLRSLYAQKFLLQLRAARLRRRPLQLQPANRFLRPLHRSTKQRRGFLESALHDFRRLGRVGRLGFDWGFPGFPGFSFCVLQLHRSVPHLNTSRIRSNSCSVCRMVSVNRGKSAGSSVGQFACIRSMLARLLFQRAFSRSVRAFHYF